MRLLQKITQLKDHLIQQYFSFISDSNNQIDYSNVHILKNEFKSLNINELEDVSLTQNQILLERIESHIVEQKLDNVLKLNEIER